MEHETWNMEHGFTVVELIITMAIAGILGALLFTSDYSLREQYFLFQEQNHLYNTFTETKNLALAAYLRNPDIVCGYGVSFQAPRAVLIYKNYKKIDGDCFGTTNHNFYYSTGNGWLNGWLDDQIIDEKNNAVTTKFSFQLDPLVHFDFGSGINRIDLLFASPGPAAFITKNGDNTVPIVDPSCAAGYICIRLKTMSGKGQGGIKINNFGQITWINN